MTTDEKDAFPVGESSGGLRSTEQIKVMICFVMRYVGSPVTRELLVNILNDGEIANYFEINSAFDALTASGAIVPAEDSGEDYVLSERGKEVARNLEGSVSSYTKDRAIAAAMKAMLYRRRRDENEVNVKKQPDGSGLLEIKIHSSPDPENDRILLSIALSAPSTIQAQKMSEAFLEDPAKLYSAIIDALAKS